MQADAANRSQRAGFILFRQSTRNAYGADCLAIVVADQHTARQWNDPPAGHRAERLQKTLLLRILNEAAGQFGAVPAQRQSAPGLGLTDIRAQKR